MEVVGVGNFGRVVKAKNLVEDRIVALKIIDKETVDLMKHADHLVSEKTVLSLLSKLYSSD
jgi:serine/threonine protein kinase